MRQSELCSLTPLRTSRSATSAPETYQKLAGVRLLFVVGTLGQGGAERQLFYILQALITLGARPRLLCLTESEFWHEPIRKLGVEVVFVGARHSRPARLLRIIKEARVYQPHVVQSQHFYTNLYATLAARIVRSREIGAIRNDGFSEIRSGGPLFGRLNSLLPRLLAANSRAAMSNLRAQIGRAHV